jgi:predicted ester cyclase
MPSITDTAVTFLDACETGKGWEGCSAHCHPDATFATQGDTFGSVDSLQVYTEAMKGMVAGPLPDAGYELKALGTDTDRRSVTAFAVFAATHTGEGGPVPPTGKRIATDFVYVMEFDGDRIRHMTKIWNDGFAMRQAGWA